MTSDKTATDANGLPLYGLDKELAERAAAKYDPEREAKVRWYIEEVSGEKFANDGFQESLKDGVLLCKAMNKIMPENPIKITTSKLAFKQMENIANFLDRMEKLGVPAHDRFLTVDLYEGKNMLQVIDSIFALSRHAVKKGFDGPLLGPKLAEKNERKFSEDQLNQGKAAVPLLVGFNGGANAKGIIMGGVRQVYDPSIEKGDTTTVSKLLSLNESPSSKPLGVVMGGRREIGGVYLDAPVEDDNGEAPTETAPTSDSVENVTEALASTTLSKEPEDDDFLDDYYKEE
ncbi:hypothetical protein HK102_002345 [Quaeritorhiza haematococci]|nr:hypothetical protein HK102_002345 [Quaeritorhiza haematococci]